MNKSSILEKLISLIPYFLFALAVIIAYRISSELSFFADFIRTAWGVILPFFYGFILAYLVNIPSSGLRKLLGKSKNKFINKYRNLLSIFVVFVILIIIVIVILNLVIPAIVDSITFFIINIPVYWEGAVQLIHHINSLDLFGLYISDEFIYAQLANALGVIRIENLLNPIAAIMGLGTTLVNGVIVFFSSIYIIVEKDKFKAVIRRLVRIFATPTAGIAFLEIFSRLNKYFRQYIRTQTIDGIILGSMATILLFLIGSPFALVLGIMLGVVNYIPYFGSIFGSLIAIIVVIFTQGATMGVVAAVSLLIIQQIDANFIQPRLMGGSFSLSPLLVIISITIGGAIAGILGMLVAIPIVAVVKDIFDSIIVYYENKKFGKGNSDFDDSLPKI